ncbi:carbamoyl phosphate synthase large subunit [Salsuginibacillus kocurii]|uniref:carbamoyl phosphate synthase large subunit n=1 Tax=Salsuginibacillus kocurii TaxID=427078 RepID=UPI00037F5F4A|nr:carbamoyl phosphate synthase large subunit [Salsuginibacillus kocurii]
MPKNESIQSVLVIGSGPIVIGQAAEFDYSGTQACLALREEGVRVILLNNNPATVMTDDACADAVYFEPLTKESVEEIIKKERPDGLLATLGGQTGLNLALSLYEENILESYNVKLLGTSIESIIKGEDREAFRSLMNELNEPVPESEIVEDVGSALEFAGGVGYPIIVRPAYTLGGGGGGIAKSEDELKRIMSAGLEMSPINQCLVEKSIAGYKEIEYEVMRDENDSCITVCNMENIDPVGVHTGDSIVTAPSQTLTDVEYQMLRSVSIKVIRALGIVGGCNIQFALDPNSKSYYLIEVNPRVSRSSALASKATGYPIARMAAKLSLGYHLHELKNPVTGYTYASFEPALDYVVVKMPRWPFDKFVHADRKLGTQMKATGEVMAIERNLEAALQKAVRSLDIREVGLELQHLKTKSEQELWDDVSKQDDRRFFVVLELLRRGDNKEQIRKETGIHSFYIDSFSKLIAMEEEIKAYQWSAVPADKLRQWKSFGFSDEWLASQWDVKSQDILTHRLETGCTPSYNMVDTCAAEFIAETSYFYSSYQGEHDDEPTSNSKKALVIGSGPIRIGQGVEFDYCSVHGVFALQRAGYETIIMNNNPETVSTDYATADRLYFEPLTAEDVVQVAEREQVQAVIVQLGGQTGISLTEELEAAGLPVVGTDSDTIDQLEDRDRFYRLMNEVNVAHIPGVTAVNKEDALDKAKEIGYPVLLRPSYVIGGQGMTIQATEEELTAYLSDLSEAVHYPILIDAFMPGKELEVDVLTDGEEILIPGVFEHVERAGVHSGDSMAVTPPYSISKETLKHLEEDVRSIAKGMNFRGIFNVQFVYQGEKLYVIEVNPRASRTVPILSKVTGVNMIDLTIQLLLGKTLPELTGGETGLKRETPYYTAKAPVFSNDKLPGLDPILSAEMKSTGELMSLAYTKEEALNQAFAWSEAQIPALYKKKGSVYTDIHTTEYPACKQALEVLQAKGYTLIDKQDNEADGPSFEDWVASEEAVAFINIPKKGESTGKEERRQALIHRKTIVTNPETLQELIQSMEEGKQEPASIQEWIETNYAK